MRGSENPYLKKKRAGASRPPEEEKVPVDATSSCSMATTTTTSTTTRTASDKAAVPITREEREERVQQRCIGILEYIADHDWVVAAKVIPREEFINRAGSFLWNYAVIDTLIFSVGVTCLQTKPDYSGTGSEILLTVYGVCMWTSCVLSLLSLLCALLTTGNTNKIPADYQEMLWFADEAMPYLLALIIIPFNVSMVFLGIGLTLYTILDYATTDSVYAIIIVVTFVSIILPLSLIFYFLFARWFQKVVSARLDKYADYVSSTNARG